MTFYDSTKVWYFTLWVKKGFSLRSVSFAVVLRCGTFVLQAQKSRRNHNLRWFGNISCFFSSSV